MPGVFIDEESGKADIEYGTNNGCLRESSITPGVFVDGDGNEFDSDGNPIDK